MEFVELTEKQKEHICHAIEHHEEYSFGGGVTVSDIESKILQDADNIDAAGAIGIVRTITFGIAHGVPFYDEKEPLVKSEYEEGGKFDPSTLHHCVNKLSRLHETMNTQTGKKLCKQRCEFIEAFVNQYLSELNINHKN